MKDEIERVVEFLVDMKETDFLNLFLELSKRRIPNEEELAHFKNHLILAVASSSKLMPHESVDGKQWSDWTIRAVAYADPTVYTDGFNVDDLAEFGTCQICQTSLVSNAKSVLCPVCKSRANLT